MQTIDIPDWLYWLIPRACLAVGLVSLIVLDGMPAALAATTVFYGGAVLATRRIARM